jgi:hypothetical protein
MCVIVGKFCGKSSKSIILYSKSYLWSTSELCNQIDYLGKAILGCIIAKSIASFGSDGLPV